MGGTALVTDSTGLVSQVYDYYPYGSELLDSQPTGASVPAEHSFTDKELDDDLGLYYFEARWYDSEIGRFGSLDPAQLDNRVFKFINDPQHLNFYAYSRNNPIKYIDPTGADWLDKLSYGAGATLETLPVTGDVCDVYTLIFGETPFTQQEASASDYAVIIVAAVIPGLTGGEAKIIKNGAEEIIENVATKLDGPHSLPMSGTPDSTSLKWKDGEIHQGRTYDENGNPSVDYDFSDHNTSDTPNPHYHDWTQNPETGNYERSTDHNELNY